MKVNYTINEKEKEIVMKQDENGYKVVWENESSLQPMFNYLLVEKDEEKSVSNGGIYIPDTIKEKPSTGTVVATGKGLWDSKENTYVPMTVKVGDRVLFPRLAGQSVMFDDVEKTLLKESEILAIIH